MDDVRGQTGSVFHKEQMLLDDMRYLGDKQTIDVKTKEACKQCSSREAGKTFFLTENGRAVSETYCQFMINLL